MKCKVVNAFIDRETKKYNEAGSEIEVSEVRFKEITKAGKYVVALESSEDNVTEKKPAKRRKES